MEPIIINKKIYVVGHKNPDTDSICSAIAYAELKKILTGDEYTPRRAGQINEETHYVLNKFGVEEPELLSDLRIQIKDVALGQVECIGDSVSIKEAWQLMEKLQVKTLPVIKEQRLIGVITNGDIVASYMKINDSADLGLASTKYRNIVSTLQGTMILGDEEVEVSKGKVKVAASSCDIMKRLVEKGDIVILGDRVEAQQLAIDLDVEVMIICHNTQLSEDILTQAKAKDIAVISTPLDSFTVARLINQSIPVRYFMTRDHLSTFHLNDYVDDAKVVMTQKKYRDFPVTNRKGNFIGFISRQQLINSGRKQVILVDHNEKVHAIDGVDEANVLEIIDHHRLGSIETIAPVFFRNQPVGCTATIVYQMYQESLTKISKSTAGLLCAAIISDTLMFRSPTCTTLDEYSARQLSHIAGVDISELAHEMFNAGSNLKGKTPEEIILYDFKEFTVNNTVIGVGQINSLNGEELEELRNTVESSLERVRTGQRLDMIFFMLTNIVDESTQLLGSGQGTKELVRYAFDLGSEDEQQVLKGVVSRKKQLIPTLVATLQH